MGQGGDDISKFGYKTNNWSKVYFIQSVNGGPIKIGSTSNVERRIKQMQTGNPDELVLLHITRGGTILESELHKKFASSRYRGEWFHPTPELLKFIDELKKEHLLNPKLLSIVELALAFKEPLTVGDKRILQKIVEGAKLQEGQNWSRYLGWYKLYQEYLDNPNKFIQRHKEEINETDFW